jgi:hypothetical protein
MTSFFQTPQFKVFEKIRDRVMVVHTQKNREKYGTALNECKNLCLVKYNNVGYDDKKKCYRWELNPDKFPPLMTKMHSEKLKRNIYIANDGNMVLIENGSNFIKLMSKEIDVLLEREREAERPANWLEKILFFKSEFEGVIL